MRVRGTSGLCLLLAALAAVCAGCGDESTEPANQAPVISGIVALPDTVLAGHATMLRCTAGDADDDDLLYTWAASAGELWGTGEVVTWAAPIPAGTYTISVVVADPDGQTAGDSVRVEAVSEAGTLLVVTGAGLTAVHTDGSHFVIRPDMRHDAEVVEQRIFVRKSIAVLDTIFEIDFAGGTVRTIPVPEVIPYPYRLVALPDGRFATIDNENDRIDFIDSEGHFLQTVAMPDPSPSELQHVSGVVVGDKLIVSENGHNGVICVDLTTYAASSLRDLSGIGVVWFSDIDFWNKYYWLCGPQESWRFKTEGDIYDLCALNESNIVGIAVVDAVAYFMVNCSPSRLYRVEIPVDPCTPELLASDLGYPTDLEYIPVVLTPPIR